MINKAKFKANLEGWGFNWKQPYHTIYGQFERSFTLMIDPAPRLYKSLKEFFQAKDWPLGVDSFNCNDIITLEDLIDFKNLPKTMAHCISNRLGDLEDLFGNATTPIAILTGESSIHDDDGDPDQSSISSLEKCYKYDPAMFGYDGKILTKPPEAHLTQSQLDLVDDIDLVFGELTNVYCDVREQLDECELTGALFDVLYNQLAEQLMEAENNFIEIMLKFQNAG